MGVNSGVSETLRKSNLFVIALWSGAVFGFLEGVALCLSRAYPVIQAAHKVSNDAIWVAPLVDSLLFLLATPFLLIALALAGKYLRNREILTAFGFFSFLGVSTVLTMPRVFHSYAAAILSLGLTMVLTRTLDGSEDGLTRFLRRWLITVPILIGLAALGTWCFQRAVEFYEARRLPAASPNATNVLVIVLDTVRADHYARPAGVPLVPNLNAIAAQGVQFTNAWSTTSWSLPSQASILTGRYPNEHHADWPDLRLDSRIPTLQTFFAQRGYVTGAFSGNAAWITPEYLGKGFLRFQVYLLEDLIRRTVLGRKLDRILNEVDYHSAGRGKKAPEVINEFLKFLDDYPDRPFFSYLCFMDVNQAEHDRKFNHGDKGQVPVGAIVSAYDHGLSELDAQLQRLFIALHKNGRWQDTLLILVSDHGISFGAQNAGDHDPSDHGTSLYREQSEVPLFVVLPGKLPAGLRVAQTVSIRQIPATITSLLGIKDAPFTGDPLPFRPEATAPADDSNPCVGAELRALDGKQTHASAICGHWEYIRSAPGKNLRAEELFDLNRDIWTRQNLAGSQEANSILLRMRDFSDKFSISGRAFAGRSSAPGD